MPVWVDHEPINLRFIIVGVRRRHPPGGVTLVAIVPTLAMIADTAPSSTGLLTLPAGGPLHAMIADTAPSSTGLLTLLAVGPETGEEGAQGRRKVCGFRALGGEGKWLIQLNATR